MSWLPFSWNPPTRTTSKPPSWSSRRTRCKHWILQQCLGDNLATNGNRWQKTSWMCWKLNGDTAGVVILSDTVMLSTRQVLCGLRIVSFVWSTVAEMNLETSEYGGWRTLIWICDVSHVLTVWKQFKSSQSKQSLEASRWFRFEAKVSSFLSPEADRQIRHVIRASRSWICCSTPRQVRLPWDIFVCFLYQHGIKLVSNLWLWVPHDLDVWVMFLSALLKPCWIRPALSTISVDRWTQRLPCMKPEVVRKQPLTWGTREAEYVLIFIV